MDDDQEKLDALGKKIDAIKRAEEKEHLAETQSEESSENMRLGLRAGTELVTAIAAGALIGYFLDKTFETKPLFFLALLVLGVITGFVNVWRTSQNIGTAVGLGHQQSLKDEKDETKE